jgi:hypothetical protein
MKIKTIIAVTCAALAISIAGPIYVAPRRVLNAAT